MNYYISPEYAPVLNGLYIFEKEVTIQQGGKVSINIFAVSRYILYIDDVYVCEGPCRSHEQVRYYDNVEYMLEKGTHYIAVKVLHTTEYFTTVYDAPVPMLAFEATVGAEVVSSDSSWDCKYLSGYQFHTYQMKCVPPYEEVTIGAKEVRLPVVQKERCVFRENGHFGGGGASLTYLLQKRPIPMIYPSDEVEIRPIAYGDGYIEYDAGIYVTAKLKFDIEKNSKVKVIYAECYEFENGKRKRDDMSGILQGYYDIISTGEADSVYEPFWWRAFRFIRVEGDCNAIRTIKAERMNYPFALTGEFVCSDTSYNCMYEVSKNTILCCAHEIIVDCPYYEQQQYEFDASVQTAVISRMTGDRRLTKKCISEFAYSQMPNGLLRSVYPASTVVQIIPSFSFMWIIMLRSYLEDSSDLEFVAEYVGTLDRILNFFDKEVKRKGYITSFEQYWNFIDWVPEWVCENRGGTLPLKKDEAHTIYNLYYACALKDAAYICKQLGREGLASDYLKRWEEMIEIINRYCYNTEKEMYQDGSITETYSMHTIIWAILSDVVTGEAARKLIECLSYDGISKSAFGMNYYLFRALEKCGYPDRIFTFFDQWQIMLDNHCTTWCENPDNPRSECHGWSSAPLYEFSSNVLGVKIGLNNEILIRPCVGNLTYAKGVVPGRFGNIYVSWQIKNSNFEINVLSQDGLQKRIIMPDGKEYLFTSSEGRYLCKL